MASKGKCSKSIKKERKGQPPTTYGGVYRRPPLSKAVCACVFSLDLHLAGVLRADILILLVGDRGGLLGEALHHNVVFMHFALTHLKHLSGVS